MTPEPGLADVLPAVAGSLGVELDRPIPDLGLPAADHVVVVLIDGLGARLLEQAAGHAKFLASLAGERVARAGFPATTATSMGSFGTGLPPGAHGLVGYSAYDPATERVFNELSWEDGPDPRQWQPNTTVLQSVASAGVETVHIGPNFFDGSGLTVAALRGARFVAARSLDDRVDAAVDIVRRTPRSLVYLYWGEVDRVGHEFGVASTAWLAELEAVDFAMRAMMRRLPAGTLVVLTADHGMLDIAPQGRIDLADHTPLSAALRAGLRVYAGEPRAPMLFAEPGQAEALAARWQEVLGDDVEVLLCAEAISAGWFGPVTEQVRPRIGDVVVSARAPIGIYDSRSQRVELTRLVGMHGARTDVETAIPLLVHQL